MKIASTFFLLIYSRCGAPDFFYFYFLNLFIHFFFPGLMDCPFLPPPAQIASAGQLNKIKQTNGIPQSLSPLTVESWCIHQWKTVPHEYTELPSATTKSSGNNAANPEPQNNHLPTFWPEEKQASWAARHTVCLDIEKTEPECTYHRECCSYSAKKLHEPIQHLNDHKNITIVNLLLKSEIIL